MPAAFEAAPRDRLRWIAFEDRAMMARFARANISDLAEDHDGEMAALFASEWRRQRLEQEWPSICFHAVRERHGLEEEPR